MTGRHLWERVSQVSNCQWIAYSTVLVSQGYGVRNGVKSEHEQWRSSRALVELSFCSGAAPVPAVPGPVASWVGLLVSELRLCSTSLQQPASSISTSISIMFPPASY